MRILTVASEAVPFAKTGGLADVIGALPRALARLGHEVDVVMPRYRGITAGEPAGQVTVRLGGQVSEAGIWIDAREPPPSALDVRRHDPPRLGKGPRRPAEQPLRPAELRFVERLPDHRLDVRLHALHVAAMERPCLV